MKRAIRNGAVLAVSALTMACNPRPDVGPVVVSVIGAPPTLADASRSLWSSPDRTLAGATAQGLVRFDASGQIEPGLAARWIVIDDGMSYIFRLRRSKWSDGRTITARDVVTALKRQIAPASRNPLAPYLTAIKDVVEMTPDVIEIDLHRPRPDLLKLFAQPEMAIQRLRPASGSGPFRIVARSGISPLMTPAADPDRAADEQAEHTPEEQVRLIGERASRALVRFAGRKSDMVTGGTIADWPLIREAGIPPARIRFDPAAGLFGLAVADRSGFLALPENRAAIAQAIDRAALAAAYPPEWTPAEQILPGQLDSAKAPAQAEWVSRSREERRAAAMIAVDEWRARHGAITLRLALPEGAGGTLLWGRIAADLLAAGITPVRIAWRAPADLRLIDRVAPYDSARWYLASACLACSGAAAEAIEAARTAFSPAERAAAIAAADAALTVDGGYIPIARPFRWSLVAPRLKAWRPNSRAWHPLNHLRAAPN